MARRSGAYYIFTGIYYMAFFAWVVSRIFEIGFGPSAGIVLAVFVAVILAFFAVSWIAARIERRKPCAHGVRGSKDGGCRVCIDEEERRQAVQKRKNEISEKANTLRVSELKVLRKRWLSSSDRYSQMTPQQFEDAIAELFRELGYEVKQTPYTNDRGKDAIAWKNGKKYLIECKRYGPTNTIGRRELQIFVAAMKEEAAQGGIYVITGRFANTVPEYAAQEHIELYDGANFSALVNRAYPVKEDVSSATVMCLECGASRVLPVGEAPTTGTCANGHTITNDITKELIRSASFAPHIRTHTSCDRCGSEMRLVNGRGGKFWGCSKYPECRFTRHY